MIGDSPVFLEKAAAARRAAQGLAVADTASKNRALILMADRLRSTQEAVLAANARDVKQARTSGTHEALIDRLRLDEARVEAMARGLEDLVTLPDPVGETVRGWDLPNGVHIDQVRVPLGVVGMIYEARPNVTADAAGICLKSGNAAVLRGSSTAIYSNKAISDALREGIAGAGLPPDCVVLLEGGHEVTNDMMAARGLIDVLIPRGGAGLIQSVVLGSQVPVIETGTGNCHLFVDESGDPDVAMGIIRNAKVQRPSVCNSLETLLVHQSVAATFIPMVADDLTGQGVALHGDQAARDIDPRIDAAADWDNEALSLDLRVAVVSDLDEAIAFIREHTSGHSETIVTNDLSHATRFSREIDAACVLVNASSRFVDGGQFGFGAEIGISTQKLHARGPMGLREMTTTKYVISGSGQIRL